VPFERYDYVFVPRGSLHRFLPDPSVRAQHWLTMELTGGLHLPKQWRNPVGQLRMDAPYCHRDFRRPTFVGPMDEGIRELVVKRNGAFHGFSVPSSPLDVVGWDGTTYPWAFPILNFQPRVSSVHVPPTWHGTFASRGALICSFVPRLVDFAPDAIPCPYPHSSVDVDEFLFYVRRQLHLAQGRRPGLGELSSRGHPPRAAPGQLRGEHRQQGDERARGDARLPLAAHAHDRGRRHRRPELHAELPSLSDLRRVWCAKDGVRPSEGDTTR
jgi:homogentisate 1,2-dioxygenase